MATFKLAQDLSDIGDDFLRIAGQTDVDPISEEDMQKTAAEYTHLYKNLGSAELVKIAGRLIKMASAKMEEEVEMGGGLKALGIKEDFGILEASTNAWNLEKEASGSSEVGEYEEDVEPTFTDDEIKKTASLIFG